MTEKRLYVSYAPTPLGVPETRLAQEYARRIKDTIKPKVLLKLVIVVDDDIDVFDESDVMWAVATRMQADRDLVTIGGSLGALLDPSADERGVTAKLGIDATRPFGEPFAAKLVMDPAKMAWARAGRPARRLRSSA